MRPIPRKTSTDITKQAQGEKFALELAKKDGLIKELENKIASQDKKIKELERGINLYKTDDDVVKKILELRSRRLSPVKIMDSLSYIGIDVDLDAIKDVVYNIKELSNELQIYYNKAEDDYENEIKINPQSLKESSLNEIVYLMDVTMEAIEMAQDSAEKDKYVKTYKDLLNTKIAMLKDVVFDERETDRNLEIVNIMSDDYEKQKANIFKVKLDENVKIIN